MAPEHLAAGTKPGSAVTVGIALALFSWVLAAAVDAQFEGAAFVEQLFDPAPGEVVLRLLFTGIQLVFILYIARIMEKNRTQGALLAAALERAETERLRSQEVLESVGDAISIQDTDFKVLYQNQAHKALMGSHTGEYCFNAYQHRDAVCGGCHLAQSYLDGMSHRVEVRAMTEQGPKFTEIISTPLRDANGKIVAGIEAVRDVTDRKRAEVEVQRMNLELEARAQELAEANRELESFSYSLSHDLRAYITRISTAQQVLDMKEDRSDPDTAYLLHTIAEACRGMECLIDAMLTLALLSRQEMQWEELSLGDLARESFLHLKQLDPERQVALAIDREVTVQGDRRLLQVALENLVGNAWKYTRDVAQPVIEFGVAERYGERCYFVKDNGIGFDMAEREKLFRPFERLQNAQRFPGTGVGLATVQRAISRHGGKVWAEAEPGKGATFYFTLGDSAREPEAGPAAGDKP
jgi:PAS domain S-box-containing protein